MSAAPGKPGDAGYVLGVNQAELERLGFQHQLWSEAAHALWERAGVQPGRTALDVGAGPGFAACDLAQIVGPAGAVIAVDEAPMYLDYLRRQREARGLHAIQTVRCDVQRLQDAGLAPASVDVAYARWVLCFVRDPGAVVRGVAGLLKPGGVFCVQDYFQYERMTLAPASPAFDRVIRAVGESWRARGGDPDIVGRLPRLMADAGLRVREVRLHPRLARPGTLLWNWPTTFFANFVPALEHMGFLSAAERTAFEADWAARSADPLTFMLTPPVYDVIAEKPA